MVVNDKPVDLVEKLVVTSSIVTFRSLPERTEENEICLSQFEVLRSDVCIGPT
jgi:hypothetical protein